MSWCIGEDFITILKHSDRKEEGYNMVLVRNFNYFISKAKVVDLPMRGITFTWINYREKASWARLVRSLVSPLILSRFPNLVPKGVPFSISDHNVIMIKEVKEDWGPSRFQFYNGWLDIKVLISDAMKWWSELLENVLTNWLKTVMNSIISETQMAFIKGRQIVDSFIIAEEIVHNWKRDKVGGLLVKLDFEKAYDSIDHSFLDDMILGMGFGVRWRGWIRDCISSLSMSALVNSSPTTQLNL
ncbi:hypothetical protein Ddye_005701 [Dipteronia dyeriana]|uniref:Reverse transcriptase domain-containing protein n=1 Tax=Dipteronia dyeriana TaxID=168575 RepID=A0AAD9XHM7_9ROSI|nr:hypothetical protein Ddye_005701 [Dipteronia dyeriana]